MSNIKHIWAREILDSRGIPTIEAACMLDSGLVAVASIPSGTSTGTHEAIELRDKDNPRHLGKGVQNAVSNVNTILGPAIVGSNPQDQFAIDKKMVQIDGTPNKSKYGANAVLAVSTAVAKAGAMDAKMSLYSYINNLILKGGIKAAMKVPIPLFNMINGGLHGAGNLDFQEFWVIPSSIKSFNDSLVMGAEIYQTIGDSLEKRGAIHSVGDEGGYAPNLFTNADALEVFIEAIKATQYAMGRDVFLGLDIAANSFFKNGEYVIRDKSTGMNDSEMLEFYKGLFNQYKIAALEDPFQEDAWKSWTGITKEIGSDVLIIGDDLLVTSPIRVQKAVQEKACNAILVKPNQIGTITETLNVIKLSREAGWKVVVSHRSGETNDSFIADFAVGVGADFVKFGAPARGERVAKYNRLSAIEYELPKTA